jgi:hypothetical protein
MSEMLVRPPALRRQIGAELSVMVIEYVKSIIAGRGTGAMRRPGALAPRRRARVRREARRRRSRDRGAAAD